MPQPVDPSFTNAASLAAQGTGTRRLDASLAKLAAASSVKPALTPAAKADDAALTRTNVLKTVRESEPLRELGSRLIEFRKIVANATATGPAGEVLKAGQSVLELLDGITQEYPPTTRLIFDSAFLDLSGDANDPSAQFVLELGGPGGVRELSFSSGTSVADIAETLELIGAQIGIVARLSGNAVVLDSDSALSAGFVGVRVLDDGGSNLVTNPGEAIAALRDAIRSGLEAIAPEKTLALLDDAIREVERAERERLLGRADGPLALEEADIPVIREAQAKLLEEARRLGLLIDHDPAKALDALRG